jgi:dTDP-4-dehydrorhamnose reductase
MILICGASGLVGAEMCKLLEKTKIPYLGTYNSRRIEASNMYKVNFFDANEVEEFFNTHMVSVCVFCIVERLTDVCENNWNDIKRVNIDLVHITSYVCHKKNVKFIHLSTDYVFDGSNQPNFPDNLKNPLQNYGMSKLISEFKVMTNCSNYCIIRTPVLYTENSKIHDNAVTLIGKNVMDLRKNIQLKEDGYSIRRPLYIPDLCLFILDCCLKSEYTGIYHFYNPHHKFTKYEMCKKIGNILSINTDNILCNTTKSTGLAPRPYDTQLYDPRINVNDYTFTNFDKTLEECFNRFKYPSITHNMHSLVNKPSYFFMIDLDGTLINSSAVHYNAYKKVFAEYEKSICDFVQWGVLVQQNRIDKYLNDTFHADEVSIVKQKKRDVMQYKDIELTQNSDMFIDFLYKNGINCCIVTNTCNATFDRIKQELPILQKIKNCVFRNDYINAKPSSDSYKVAMNKYYNNEQYVVGIEDSLAGVQALKDITPLIFVYDNVDVFKTEDAYLFNDYKDIL